MKDEWGGVMFEVVIAGHICLDIHPDLTGENRDSIRQIIPAGTFDRGWTGGVFDRWGGLQYRPGAA